MHSIHGREIYFTDLTKFNPFFHRLAALKPLKILKTEPKKLKNNTTIITSNALATLEKLAIVWC